jgi:hypothetical protein
MLCGAWHQLLTAVGLMVEGGGRKRLRSATGQMMCYQSALAARKTLAANGLRAVCIQADYARSCHGEPLAGYRWAWTKDSMQAFMTKG